MQTTDRQTWWHTTTIAEELGTSEREVVDDILKGVYRNPSWRNGEWFVPKSEVERVFFARITPEQLVNGGKPSPARRHDSDDMGVISERWHRGMKYLSLSEAGRRLGMTYGEVYRLCRRKVFKTERHIHHHRYLTEKEVHYYEVRRQRPR